MARVREAVAPRNSSPPAQAIKQPTRCPRGSTEREAARFARTRRRRSLAGILAKEVMRMKFNSGGAPASEPLPQNQRQTLSGRGQPAFRIAHEHAGNADLSARATHDLDRHTLGFAQEIGAFLRPQISEQVPLDPPAFGLVGNDPAQDRSGPAQNERERDAVAIPRSVARFDPAS